MPSFATLYALHQLPFSRTNEEGSGHNNNTNKDWSIIRNEEEKEEKKNETENSLGQNSAGDRVAAPGPPPPPPIKTEKTSREEMTDALTINDDRSAPYLYLDPTRREQLLYQDVTLNPFYPDPMHRDMTQLLGQVSISTTKRDLVRTHLTKKLKKIEEANRKKTSSHQKAATSSPLPLQPSSSSASTTELVIDQEEGKEQEESKEADKASLTKESIADLEGNITFLLLLFFYLPFR